MSSFSQRIIRWQQDHGRHHLPWQQEPNRYRVWVSEIMLQQTQVATAIPYFERFIQRFPTVADLASAPQDDVLALWAGLGYYARARNLHKAAQQVMEHHAGTMPDSPDALEALPGIGRSTAAAIVSLTDGAAWPILDGNVKRVLARHDAVAGWPGSSKTLKQLWLLAEQYMPVKDARAYNQGLMDLGSQLCTRSRPLCGDCPVASDCLALAAANVAAFPAFKPAKKQPQKTAAFLWLENHEGQIWLQQRPPTGIWGGLWCLPQFENIEALQQSLLERWGIDKPLTAKVPVQHVFSHYKLRLEPYQLRLGPTQKTLTIAEENAGFVPQDRLAEYGLPAPIKKLLCHSW